MKRRDFLVRVGGAGLMLPLVRLGAGCSDESDNSGGGGSGDSMTAGDADAAGDARTPGDTLMGGDTTMAPGDEAPTYQNLDDYTGTLPTTPNIGVHVGGAHGHDVLVPAADIAASTTDKTYTLGGVHTHTITVTASDFDTLRACGTVTKVSTSSGHTHTCTLRAC